MEYTAEAALSLPIWPTADEIKRVRDELDRLVRERFDHGLSADDLELYEALAHYEERLLLTLARLTN